MRCCTWSSEPAKERQQKKERSGVAPPFILPLHASAWILPVAPSNATSYVAFVSCRPPVIARSTLRFSVSRTALPVARQATAAAAAWNSQ